MATGCWGISYNECHSNVSRCRDGGNASALDTHPQSHSREALRDKNDHIRACTFPSPSCAALSRSAPNPCDGAFPPSSTSSTHTLPHRRQSKASLLNVYCDDMGGGSCTPRALWQRRDVYFYIHNAFFHISTLFLLPSFATWQAFTRVSTLRNPLDGHCRRGTPSQWVLPTSPWAVPSLRQAQPF